MHDSEESGLRELGFFFFSSTPNLSGRRGLLLRFPRSQRLKQYWPDLSCLTAAASLTSVCQALMRPEQEDYKFKTSLGSRVRPPPHRLPPICTDFSWLCDWRWKVPSEALHTHEGPLAVGCRGAHPLSLSTRNLSSFPFLHYILERLPRWATT